MPGVKDSSRAELVSMEPRFFNHGDPPRFLRVSSWASGGDFEHLLASLQKLCDFGAASRVAPRVAAVSRCEHLPGFWPVLRCSKMASYAIRRFCSMGFGVVPIPIVLVQSDYSFFAEWSRSYPFLGPPLGVAMGFCSGVIAQCSRTLTPQSLRPCGLTSAGPSRWSSRTASAVLRRRFVLPQPEAFL